MLSHIQSELHDAGYKFTKPRQLVAEMLMQSRHHLTANQLWDRIREVDPSIGRMSVYRTLEVFTEIGLVRPIANPYGNIRDGAMYVIMHEGHHHHIVCKACNKIIHFEDCGLDELISRLENKFGVTIQEHLLEFYGMCDACQP